MDTATFIEKSFARLRACFIAVEGGTLVHGKVEKIRGEVEQFSRRQRERAGLRWKGHARTDAGSDAATHAGSDAATHAGSDAGPMPSSPSASASPSSSEENTCAFEPKARVDEDSLFLIGTEEEAVSVTGVPEAAAVPKVDLRVEWFAQFWKEYGPLRSRAKQDALKAFMKVVRNQAVFDVVMAALRDQTPEMLSRNPDKRPYASTWLRSARYEDEPEATPRKQGAASTGIEAAMEILKEQAT